MERCARAPLGFPLSTAMFSAWIFLFKKIHVGDHLECTRAARSGERMCTFPGTHTQPVSLNGGGGELRPELTFYAHAALK